MVLVEWWPSYSWISWVVLLHCFGAFSWAHVSPFAVPLPPILMCFTWWRLSRAWLSLLAKQLGWPIFMMCFSCMRQHERSGFGQSFSLLLPISGTDVHQLHHSILAGTGQWRVVYWLIFGFGCLNTALIVGLVDETWYRRDIATAERPNRGNRLARIIGTWQIKFHHGYFAPVLQSVRRVWNVLCKPTMTLVMLY